MNTAVQASTADSGAICSVGVLNLKIQARYRRILTQRVARTRP
jgi:hypothetical protein